MLQPSVFPIAVHPKCVNPPSSSQDKGAKRLLQQSIFFYTALIFNATHFVLVRLVLLLGFLEPDGRNIFRHKRYIKRKLNQKIPVLVFSPSFWLGKLSAWQGQPAVQCGFFRYLSLCLHGLYRETKPERKLLYSASLTASRQKCARFKSMRKKSCDRQMLVKLLLAQLESPPITKKCYCYKKLLFNNCSLVKNFLDTHGRNYISLWFSWLTKIYLEILQSS